MKTPFTIKNFITLVFIGLIILISFYIYQKSKGASDTNIFSRIYKNDKWTKGSGPGSTIENTVEYRKLLQDYFNDHRFRTIIDLGCGDFQFMKLINIPSNKTYKGIDVVHEVIEEDKKLYGKENVQFYFINDLYDIKQGDKLFRGDLLIIKDVLMHLPNAKVQYFIDKILPNFKYALITDTVIPNDNMNKDILTGQWRPVDITAPPFNLENVVTIMDYEKATNREKYWWKKRVYFYTNPRL